MLIAAPVGGARTSASFVMRLSPQSITVGSYRLLGPGPLPTYAGAIKAFGTPQACTLRQSNWVRARVGPPLDSRRSSSATASSLMVGTLAALLPESS